MALWAAFVLVNLVLLATHGVRPGGDTVRYLTGARSLRGGVMPVGLEWFYVSYTGVVAVMQTIGAGLPGVVGLQIGVAVLAGWALVSLGAVLGGSLAGVVGAAFVLANPDVARWHTYILTDSLYISTVILAVWAMWRATERGGAWYVVALLILVPATTLRPSGLVLVPVALVFWALRGAVLRDRRGVALALVGIVGAGLFLWYSPLVQSTLGRFPGYMLRTGQVFYNDTTFSRAMPQDGSQHGLGFGNDLAYVFRHPGASVALAARRVGIELAHVRPAYTTRHNLLIGLMVVPLYGLAALGAVTTWRHSLTHLLLVIIVGHLGLVAITLADLDGRFVLHVFGPLAVLAAAGVGRLVAGLRAAPPA